MGSLPKGQQSVKERLEARKESAPRTAGGGGDPEPSWRGDARLEAGLHDLTKPHPHPQVLGPLSQSG